MAYHLLTGATGLLGSYLLNDFLVAGLRVAVLVRPTKLESARQRVESIMTRWEKLAGFALPRPVILEGNLFNDRFDLSDEQLRWVTANCTSLVQNAASVTYYGERPHEDPWRTNVGGTENALAFCKRIGIRQFHHVSTAYVCGKREGLIYEGELDEGQDLNTDYERSKFEGEQLIRAASHIDPPTFYRAAIIIGDSRTGYTPTFHGFYVPLKLVHTMFKHIIRDTSLAGPLQESIEIQGHERKNLIPVDWISEVMTHIITHPEHHGQTFHLAPDKPVTVNVMRDAMVQGFLTYGDISQSADQTQNTSWSFNQDEFVEYFRNQMKIYESYWKDDPLFDLTNTRRAAPHLPPPEVNCEMLVHLCKYALESNFGWPRAAPIQLELDVHQHLEQLLKSDLDWDRGQPIGLQVNGPGGGQWELMLDSELRPVSARPGLSTRSEHYFYLNTDTFSRLLRNEISVGESLRTSQALIQGNTPPPAQLASVLRHVTRSSA